MSKTAAAARNERPEEARRRLGQASALVEVDPRQQNIDQELERAEMVAKLEAKRDELVERLDKGSVRIEAARDQGKDVTEWEDYWISLLRQYEQICDKLKEIV